MWFGNQKVPVTFIKQTRNSHSNFSLFGENLLFAQLKWPLIMPESCPQIVYKLSTLLLQVWSSDGYSKTIHTSIMSCVQLWQSKWDIGNLTFQSISQECNFHGDRLWLSTLSLYHFLGSTVPLAYEENYTNPISTEIKHMVQVQNNIIEHKQAGTTDKITEEFQTSGEWNSLD